LLVPVDEPPLAPPVLLGLLGLCVEDEPMEPDEPDEEEPLEEPLPMLEPELEGLELDDVPPAELDFWLASHSERESLPSWSLSSLSNSLEELEEEEEPPAAELGLDEELEPEEPPAADDEDGEDVDDLLLCDMVDGEDEAPELLLLSPAA